MGRWTQDQEDASRLPEGVKRIGYDADSARYKFCDREGNLYLGPPHEYYGALTLVGKTSRPPSSSDDRPQAFAPEKSRPELSVDVPVHAPPGSGSTFHDFVPPHLITSPSSAQSTLSSHSGSPLGSGSRFRDAVRRTALPSMANVVNNVKRSATMLRKPRARDRDRDRGKKEERDGLLHAPKNLTRSNTTATTATESTVGQL
ncbi:hypothetical protein MSAN_00897000 [Mycena sanguinolenta]|uniref:Uncharacterized protein n=1 Tax=Mycena sanguinolenta TaxID=230812 RepID=A0A8H7DB91_9AGAR|nr:hypothetical protein MSAN_00897000 [Mycena sanguinolenta]